MPRIHTVARPGGGVINTAAAGVAYQRIIDRLRSDGRKVRESRAGQATAQCPAYDDRNPSLKITGIEGQVLIHCHAQCPIENVLASLGITMRDLYDNPKDTSYTYEDGRNAHRTWDKRFWQTGNTNGHNATQLYRLTGVKSAVFDSKTIWLVEGEKDCHAIEALGEVATTAPMGATNFHKVDASPLHGAKIKAIVDKDDSGEEWAKQVRDKLDGQAGTVEFYQAKVGKDAADHIAAGHTLEELEAFEAPDLKPALRLVEAVDVTISRVRFLWANRIPLGAFTSRRVAVARGIRPRPCARRSQRALSGVPLGHQPSLPSSAGSGCGHDRRTAAQFRLVVGDSRT
jgi:5S rRNA maturation endonuclease (ribonuclease M5)